MESLTRHGHLGFVGGGGYADNSSLRDFSPIIYMKFKAWKDNVKLYTNCEYSIYRLCDIAKVDRDFL